MEFHAALRELETLVETLEREGDERALLLLELVDAIHRPGLALLADGRTEEEAAQTLLAMYDLVEVDERILAEEALDGIRPYVESHGGAVELLGVDDGLVRVRMSGACEGCAGSATTLRRGVEAALREAMPTFRGVVDEKPTPDGGDLLQIELRAPVFVRVEAGPEAGGLRTVLIDGMDVLLARVDQELYAFRDGCVVDGLPLGNGRLSADGVLVCPWHNCAYDARSGKRVDDPEAPGMAVLPIAVDEGGGVRVAVGTA